jgi:hypothetical protein
MIGELTMGRRYRITLKSAVFRGYLEGTLRSTRLPRGVLGNDDGEHSIWLSGESFEWFLRPLEIDSATELPEPDEDEAHEPILEPRVCAGRWHPSRAVLTGVRAVGEVADPGAPRAIE